ncbi:squamosa promoter-binding-like protein 7 [Malania oleifera]|uniref:squamosa promoter-binding-like protein 7 n=1 Tax=Malania oleifera TaxID=397392 RepID=UPI0025AE1F80|nr:squamosa promoter-binding-like protein 7 [Malania oleifera]
MDNPSASPCSSPSPSPSPSPPLPRVSDMDVFPPISEDSTAVWDWGDLLDFTVDDHLAISWDSDRPPLAICPPPDVNTERASPSPEGLDRVRKRDPRLTCSNFLAGRIPCACPEMDEKMNEEGAPGKKRARTARATAGMVRCQVPGCEADIRELKGYHRRHRVCLRCANAGTVLLDGQTMRYCQQCGKFHILSDFDEGKRSCRRKLERHNNRRRRKPCDSKSTVEKESQGDQPAEDGACDNEAGKESLCLNSQVAEGENLLESSDMYPSTLGSTPGSKNVQSDSVASVVLSGDAQMDGGKDGSKYTLSSVYSDNKSAYSSMCSTGRISFKLYDWNPAEFPRRLRHQIFQWLASMPVELEGYIRPGCTILTAFIAMPKLMWVKLYEDPALYIHHFVVAPGGMLFGKGTFFVYLNNIIFCVEKDGTSITKIKAEMRAPRLHYVHPICFEAGRPMEFIACGSNLSPDKFRFLISFAGKYLPCDYCIAVPHGESEGNTDCSYEHQLYKIYIAHTEPNLFGPAFIEVENESGLSNFLPILIGDREVCSEMMRLQQKFDASLRSKGSELLTIGSPPDPCEVFVLRQTSISEFLLDMAWLLREPASDNFQHVLIASQIQRFNCLLSFLIQNKSIIFLEKFLQYMKVLMDNVELNSLFNNVNNADMRLFLKHMDHAKDIIHQRVQKSGVLVVDPGNYVPKGDHFSQSCFENYSASVVPFSDRDVEAREDDKFGVICSSVFLSRGDAPLLDSEAVVKFNHIEWQPRNSCGRIFSTKVISSRLVFVIATVAVCFGICAVLFHPHKVGEFAVTIRRCLFDTS